MSKLEKLLQKILQGCNVSYEDAEKILLHFGFDLIMASSHHIFRKKGYAKNISLKKRPLLLPYQIKILKEILNDHGYTA